MSTQPGSDRSDRDPIGDFQRWLMKAGAKSIGTRGGGPGEVHARRRRGGAKHADDVWDTATTEELTDEPPECQWCPICRAARRYRDSGGTARAASSPGWGTPWPG